MAALDQDRWYDSTILKSGTGMPEFPWDDPSADIWVRGPNDAGETSLMHIPRNVAEKCGYGPSDFRTGRRIGVQVRSWVEINNVCLGELPDGFAVVKANIAALAHFVGNEINELLRTAFEPIPPSCGSDGLD